MKWSAFPFVRYTLALILGIVSYTYLPYTVTQVRIAAGGIGLLFLLGWMPVWRTKFAFRGTVSFLLLLCIGWLLTWQADERNDSTHLIHTKTPVVAYQAVLSSLVESKINTFRVTATVSQSYDGTHWQPASGNILLFIDKEVPIKPAYGQVLLIYKAPERVEAPQNPDEFDYRTYLSYQHIYFQQYLHPTNFQVIDTAPQSVLFNWAARINSAAVSVLSKHLPSRNEFAVAAAMLLGVRDELGDDLLKAYSVAGAIHTLSVSGMHVGILFLVLSSLLKPLRNGRKANKLAFLGIVLCFLWGYALVTGLSAPVLRSVLMLSFFAVGDTFKLNRNSFNTLALSAFLILIVSPYDLFQMGFQLSYLSVFGILYLYPKFYWLYQPKNPLLLEIWSMSCGAVAAQLLTFPLATYYFHQFPTYFLLVNPLILALSSIGLIVGMGYLVFCLVPILHSFFLYVLKLSFGLLNMLVFQTEHLPGAAWTRLYLSTAQVWILYLILAGMVILFYTRQRLYLLLVIALAVGLTGLKILDFNERRNQTILVVHHLKKHTALSLIRGQELYLLADSALYQDRRTKSLHLEQFWTARGIRQTHENLHTLPHQRLPYGEIFNFHDRKILLISTPLTPDQKVSGSVDFLIVTNNSIRKPKRMCAGIRAKQIVLDVTNSRKTARTWRAYAESQKIAFHDVRTEGAFYFRW